VLTDRATFASGAAKTGREEGRGKREESEDDPSPTS
jgi:hypothetical protein